MLFSIFSYTARNDKGECGRELVCGTGGCGGWEFSRLQILVDNELLSADRF